MARTHTLPHYCSQLCANEAHEAGAHSGEWVDTESEAYLDAHPDAEERCDWCSPTAQCLDRGHGECAGEVNYYPRRANRFVDDGKWFPRCERHHDAYARRGE